MEMMQNGAITIVTVDGQYDAGRVSIYIPMGVQSKLLSYELITKFFYSQLPVSHSSQSMEGTSTESCSEGTSFSGSNANGQCCNNE